MLAALLATRQIIPPPLRFRYSNQLIAAVNTFVCISVTRAASRLTSSLQEQWILSVSLPGRECYFDQLNRQYFLLISPRAGFDPDFLSDTIARVISIATKLTPVIGSLPVAPGRENYLHVLQHRLYVALAVLNSLGMIIPS
jgi:hypothetical protein